MRRLHVELSLTEIGDVVEASMQSMLGEVTVEEGAPIWPLSSMMAQRLGKDRIALVCELKAQYFNLRLRDITCR